MIISRLIVCKYCNASLSLAVLCTALLYWIGASFTLEFDFGLLTDSSVLFPIRFLLLKTLDLLRELYLFECLSDSRNWLFSCIVDGSIDDSLEDGTISGRRYSPKLSRAASDAAFLFFLPVSNVTPDTMIGLAVSSVDPSWFVSWFGSPSSDAPLAKMLWMSFLALATFFS